MDEFFEIENSNPYLRLLEYLKRRAQPYQRPFMHKHIPVDVHVKVALYQIVDLVSFLFFFFELLTLTFASFPTSNCAFH